MSLAATIRAMRAAGIDDDKIIDTVLAIEEERLANGRARVAKHRINKKTGNVTPVTSVTDITKKEAVSPTPPSEEKNIPPSAPKGASSPTDEFETWWAEVPRKVSKGQARKAYRAARKVVGADVLIAGIRRYAAEVRARGSPEFTKHPATWLNGECWNDDPMEIANAPRTGQNHRTGNSPHDKLFAGFSAAARQG